MPSSHVVAVCLFAAVLGTCVAAEPMTGRVLLRDASNDDRAVGADAAHGISQGHTLKISLGDGRFGKRVAAGTHLTVVVSDAEVELARTATTLDASGYGEALVLISDGQAEGVYQVRMRLRAGDDAESGDEGHDRGHDSSHDTGLGAVFRVIEGEPNRHVPQMLPFLALVLGAGLLLLWSLRSPRV